MDIGAKASSDPPSVGSTLAALRRAAGLSGSALAQRVGMSQAKISRIETGATTVDPSDVERITRALGADDSLVGDLVGRAMRLRDQVHDTNPFHAGLAGGQYDMAALEGAAREIRVFQPSLVAGLLQTSEYARAILTGVRAYLVGSDLLAPAGVAKAVSARIRRQEILADPDHHFAFVMTESSLSNRLCPPEHMPAQIERIRQVKRQENVSLLMLPAEGGLDLAPIHGFVILDDSTVQIDLMNTALITRGASEIHMFRQIFDAFQRRAITDIDTILDRYMHLYLDLSRPRQRSAAAAEEGGGGEAGSDSQDA